MKKQRRMYRSILIVALATCLVLMVPLVAMQFTAEVNWSLPDFLAMGTLLSGTGLAGLFLLRTAPNIHYRLASGLALAITFLMIWANLAVGLIGSGPNMGNLMYGGVVLIAVAGSFLSGFRPAGMERTMYAAAGAVAALTVIAFLSGIQREPGSSVAALLCMGGFFTGVYLIAGLLFRYAVKGALLRRI